MTTNTKQEVTKMITAPCRAVFPHLDTTEEFNGQDTGKYTVTLELTPDSVTDIQKAITSVGSGKGTNPLKQIPDDAEYSAGHFRMKAKSRFKVRVIDINNKDVDPSSISNGDEVRASIGLAHYKTGVNEGVTIYLNALQLLSSKSAGQAIDFGELPPGYEPGADLEDALPF